jgi:hypothetical protein
MKSYRDAEVDGQDFHGVKRQGVAMRGGIRCPNLQNYVFGM